MLININFKQPYINTKEFNKKKIISNVEKIAKQAFILLDKNLESQFSINFVSNYKIKKLNNKYRNTNKPTDVLSFPFNIDFSLEDEKFNLETFNYDLGDIFISIKKVKENAKRNNNSFLDELLFIITHGILHLSGYNHDNIEEEDKMNALSFKIIKEAFNE